MFDNRHPVRTIRQRMIRLSSRIIRRTGIEVRRLSTIRDADRVAVMRQGRIVELGPHDELISRGGLYARRYAAQAA